MITSYAIAYFAVASFVFVIMQFRPYELASAKINLLADLTIALLWPLAVVFRILWIVFTVRR